MCSVPAWKQLIKDTLSTHQRVSLISSIFSHQSEIDVVELLSGNDAQEFIDIIDEVSITLSCLQTASRSTLNYICFLGRFRMISRERSTGGASTIHTEFVAANPCFRNHLRFQFVMTRWRPRSSMGGLQTCGRANIMAGRLRLRL